MPNRYTNLVGSKKISEDWNNINIGFDRVQAEMDTKGTPADAQSKADAAKTAAIAAAAADLATHKARGADEHPTAKGNAAGFMSAADKLKSDASTSAATPDTLMQRDAEGRAKVAAPAAADDIARKAETDAVQTKLDSHAADTVKHVTQAEHDKLNGIAAGAEVNQNAFAKVNDVEASSKSDTVRIEGGTGITVTTDPEGKRIMLTATGEATPGAHASSHVTGGTDVIPDAVIGGSSGLMSGADAKFVRQDGESKTGAQAKADAAKQAANEYTDQKVSGIVVGDASLTEKGIVQLSNETDGDSEDVAATERAVSDARTAAITAAAADATTKADAAQAAAQTTAQNALNTHANRSVRNSDAHGLRINAGKLEYNNGSTWVPASSDYSGPTYSTANLVYWVNGSTGNDNWNGTNSITPFNTIAKALSMLPDVINHTITINIAAGTYNEDIVVQNKSGAGGVHLVGAADSTILKTISILYCTLPYIRLQSLNPTAANNGTAVQVGNCPYTLISGVNPSLVSSSTGIQVSYGLASIINCVISNGSRAILAVGMSTVLANTNSGTGNSFGLTAREGATIGKVGTQPGAATAEVMQTGGVIRA